MNKHVGIASATLGALAVGALGIVVLPAAAHAADLVTVNTVAELQNAVSSASGDTTILLGDGFPQTLPNGIVLTSASAFAIEIDGAGKTLYPAATGRHITANVSGAGTFALKNLTLTIPEASAATNGGLQLTQSGSAAVRLSGLDFVSLKNSALSLDGSGTGALTVENSSFVGNTAPSASAVYFSRSSASAQTLFSHTTFDSNVGTSGAGYSGGAVRGEAGSQGTLTIEDSAFISNKFLEGGTQPRGGAIALHNSNVQLHLDRDYFAGNSTASSSTPANADGGAVSSFNSTANTTGSVFVSDSTFENNQAQDDGAALFIEGRAASATGPFSARLVVENSTFINNVSGDTSGDSGGAIQASLRAEVTLTHNTFVGNTKANSRGGVDVGGHLGLDGTYGIQQPVISAANNIFTLAKSVDLSYVKCSVNVGCSNNSATVTASTEPQLTLDVFGTATPAAAVNGSARVVGDAREGKTPYPLTTVRIAPPLSAGSFTAYQAATQPTALTSDQRGVAFKSSPSMPDAGSLEMNFVKFDAQANGGSWSGQTSTFPDSGNSYFAGADAGTGWYEVGNPSETMSFPSVPTAPTGTTFTGWFSDPVGGTKISAVPTAQGQTLYAQFAAITHTVTFDSSGGSPISPITDVPDGSAVAQPTAPTRTGYEFQGWTLDGVDYDFSSPVTSDITLTAAWSLLSVDPETSVTVADVSYVYGDRAPISAEVQGAQSAGSVTFLVDGNAIGTAAVVNGLADFMPAARLGLDAGSYPIVANYSEDGGVTTAAVGHAVLTVRQAATATTIVAQMDERDGDQATVRVSGVVSAEFGTVSTGTVTIYAQGTAISIALPLDAQGRYQGVVTVFLAPGSESLSLTAQHSGDINHLSSSAAADLAVTPEPSISPEPSVTPTASSTLTAGASAGPDTELPGTGVNGVSTVVVIGSALIAVGTLAAWGLRRRSHN